MSSRIEKASDRFSEGYNCAQSVFSAFSSSFGLDEKRAIQIASGFGGGMARLQEVCGAVTGAFMVFGTANGEADPSNPVEKAQTDEQVLAFSKRFRKMHGSLLCRDLLELDLNTEEGQQELKERDLLNTVCARCVRDAATIVEDLITEK